MFRALLLLLLPLMGMAQNIDVSAPTKLTNRAPKFKIIGKNEDGYVVRLYGTEDVLQAFSSDLRLVASRTLQYKNQNGLLQHVQLNRKGANVFYLISEKTKSTLIAQPLSGRFADAGQNVSLDTLYDRPDLCSANLRVKQSLNQAFLLFYYPYFRNDKIESIRTICVDRALNVVYARTVLLDRPEEEMEAARVAIDNNGNSYLAFVADKKKSTTEGENIIVYKVSGETDTVQVNNLRIDKNLFGEMYFEADNQNNSVVLCGFYDDADTKNEAAAYGFFYSRFDPDSVGPPVLTYTTFSPSFMNELTGRQTSDTKLFTFNIKKVILRNDGGALFLAESLIKDTRETVFNSQFSPTFNSIQRTTYYQYNDIIAYSITPDGKEDWHSVMRKKQVSEEDNGIFSSFLITNEKERLRLLFLDEITTGAVLTEYTVSSTGETVKNQLLAQETKDVMLLPKAGKQVSPNEVVMPSYLRNMLRLVKITY